MIVFGAGASTYAAGCEDFATSRLTEVTDTAVPAGDTTRRCLMSQARLVGEI